MAAIKMDRIVELVREAGFAAYVEQTGGACATIYASRRVGPDGYPERDASGHFEVAAGPGSWSEGWPNGEPISSSEDFCVGPDDDGETEATYCDGLDETAIAAMITLPWRAVELGTAPEA